jgi:hypothetical protein
MPFRKRLAACLFALAAISLTSCKLGNKNSQSTGESTPQSSATGTSSNAESGIEKVKPAPGTGNVQGKVLYNDKPVENIEVKLCETFSQYVGGCGGKTYTARTDKDGEYVITNVEPKTYEGLLAKVFDTDFYVFATSGIGVSASNYEVVANKTLFVSPTHLFKSDLKVINPKAGTRISAQNLELKWQPYPDADYYKFSVYPEDTSITSPYVNERVDGTSFAVDKPLARGTYRLQITAYNSADRKLSESSSDIKFTIAD